MIDTNYMRDLMGAIERSLKKVDEGSTVEGWYLAEKINKMSAELQGNLPAQ